MAAHELVTAPELATAAEWDDAVVSAGPVEVASVPRRRGSDAWTRTEPRRASGGFVYDGARAGRATRAGLSRRSASSRPLPMEDVYFYIKKFNNTNLGRRPDPADRATWLRFVGVGILGLLMMITTFAPRPLLRHSGYRLEKLNEKYQALAEIQDQLRVRQARLSDLRRVADLAGRQGLEQTPPERFAWQDRTIPPVSQETELAWNQTNAQP